MDATLSEKELRDSLDAEIKRMSKIFRFILKYQERFQPSGIEFSGLREYLPSDDAKRIDWKNSAGKPELYVKQYEEEVNLDIFIILDVSDTMTFGTAEKLKSEYSAVLSSAIAYASVDVGMEVGFGMYGDDKMFITPGKGQKQYQKVLTETVKQENYGGKFNFEQALNDMIGRIKENTAVFVISDFLEVEGEWKSNLALASKKFRNFTCIMVRDLRDYKLPDSGNVRMRSPGGDTMVVNTSKIGEDFNKEALKQEKNIQNKIEESGADFTKIDTRDNFAAELASFFSEEKRGV